MPRKMEIACASSVPAYCILTVLAFALGLVGPPARADAPKVDVIIQGISGEVLDNVKAGLSLYREKDNPLLNYAVIRRLYRKGDGEIKKAMQPFGYYRPKIQSKLNQVEGVWKATYEIQTGLPVRIAHLSVEIIGPGGDDPKLQAWRKQFPLQVGDVFRDKPYEDAKKALLNLAQARGYLDGKLEEHKVVINLKQYDASIFLHYHSGPRFRFGQVSFNQHTFYFKETFLRRFLNFKPGDPYDVNKLLALQRALVDTNYFQAVDVRPRTSGATDRTVPIDVDLTPNKRTRYTAGVGYSTDTGPRLSLGMERRYVNSRGDRFGANLSLSTVQSSFTANFTVPRKNPLTDSLTYSLAYIDTSTDTSQSKSELVSIVDIRQQGKWQRSLGLDYRLEDFEVGTQTGRARLLMPHIGWQRVKADQVLYTHRGWRVITQFQGAAQQLGSNVSFAQASASGKYIHSVSAKGRIIARTDLGTTWTSDFAGLPPSRRFFAGGDQSVRGYAYQSLGPLDDAGDVIGGKNLLVGSIEYDHVVYKNWSAAVFYDIGNAFDGTKVEPKRGSGVGVRWHLPFGTLRVDVAAALSEPGNPLRLHITMGPDL